MGNVNMEASQINFRGGDKKMSVETALKNATGEAAAIAQLQEDVTNLNGSKANKVDIAPEFSDLTNYNAGDLVYNDDDLYEFQVDHTAGAWETSEVIQKDLSDIITTLKSGLTSVKTIQDQANYGSATDIRSASFSSPFVVSTDGYIRVKGTGIIYLNASDDSNNVTLADLANVTLYSLFVKKGARVYGTGFTEIKFLALA